MDNIEDEIVVRLVLFKTDFQDVLKYFEYAKNAKDKFVRDGIIKIAIVTYAKPFLASKGVHKEVKKFSFDQDEFVPEEYSWLHEMFMNYRGNYIGHANFKSLRPNVPSNPRERDGMVEFVNYTGITYDHWFKRDSEDVESPMLIDEAIKLTSIIIDKLPGQFLRK